MHAPFALSFMPKAACLLEYPIPSVSAPEVVELGVMPYLPKC